MMAISPIVPPGFANVPIPVNPARVRNARPVEPTSRPRRDVDPVARISRGRDAAARKNPQTYAELEALHLLSVEIRRVLLELSEDHPLSGPHPTD
jgi:hypothetical protein